MTTSNQLLRSTPEAQGISSTAISRFIDAVQEQRLELHSLMLLRHGQVIAEGWWAPYSPARVHLLYSLSKSFTATAIGLAIDEGRLTLDDPALSFFPDKQPAPVSEHLAAMRVRHLLSMGTGHREDALGRIREDEDEDWIAGFFRIPPDQEPGSIFAYNNGATYMLSAILQQVTGMKLGAYLQPRLFEPLGIRAWHWLESSQGINLGFSGLHLTTEAIARFGQLYLQQGVWQGQQLIPKWWVETATANHIATKRPDEERPPDWLQGYGYQFWQCRHKAYRGDGAFGQFCLVMPEQDAVLATTAGVEDMQAVLDLVWAHLLPALGAQALPENVPAQQTLAQQLAQLAIQPVQGQATSPLAATISGQTYRVQAEDGKESEVMLYFQEDTWMLAVVDDEGEHRVRGGYNTWESGATTYFNPEEVPVVSSGAWTGDDSFVLTIRYIQTPHCLTLTFHFGGEMVQVKKQFNVSFGPTELPPERGWVKG